MKKLFLLLILSIALFPLIGEAKAITKEDLIDEAESLKEETNNGTELAISNITVGDDTIVFDLSDNTQYSVNYELGENTTIFTTSTSYHNGMTQDEFYKASTINYGHLLTHMMLCHFNDVSYDDAFAYFISMGRDNIFDNSFKSYMIVSDGAQATSDSNTLIINESEFGNRVIELVDWLYNGTTYTDVNNIYDYVYSVDSLNDNATVTLRMTYKNDADYSNMDGESTRFSSDDDEYSDMFNYGEDTVKKTNPKTGTTVDVPNTALNVDKKIYVIGLMLVLSGLLLINKVVKRKSN